MLLSTLGAGASTGHAQSKATTIAASDVIVAPVSDATRITAKPVLPHVMCPPPDGTRPDPTLVNVDPFVLERFPLRRVY